MKSERFEHLKQDFYDMELVERVAITCDDKNYKVIVWKSSFHVQ